MLTKTFQTPASERNAFREMLYYYYSFPQEWTQY